MPEEVTNISEIKTSSDGNVKISVEKYNELVQAAAAKPVVVNRTQVIRTAEMLAADYRFAGGTLMGLGASMFVVGVLLYKNGRS